MRQQQAVSKNNKSINNNNKLLLIELADIWRRQRSRRCSANIIVKLRRRNRKACVQHAPACSLQMRLIDADRVSLVKIAFMASATPI